MRGIYTSLIFYLLIVLCCCSSKINFNRHLLAEDLLSKGKYEDSGLVFEKIFFNEPNKDLAHSALFEAATVEDFYLLKYDDALEKYKLYIQISDDLNKIWEAQLRVGEILFYKKSRYPEAVQHYQKLLKLKELTPEEAIQLKYIIGRSYYFMMRFKEAVKVFQEILLIDKQSKISEKAFFEIGNCYLADKPLGLKLAKETFEGFIQAYPSSSLVSEAQVSVGSCLEEMELLNESANYFSQILKEGSPFQKLIEFKLSRIHQRMMKRKD